jgi:hypothetical protein
VRRADGYYVQFGLKCERRVEYVPTGKQLGIDVGLKVYIQNVTKIYGKRRAIDNLSFDVHQGEIFGFLMSSGRVKSCDFFVTIKRVIV